jgi:VIT1/CCC1 family predicted Fe2+/Mn2+ transporter
MKIKESFMVGFNFGLTSGAITTMGVMVGLYAGTNSVKIVIGGILTIAIADAFSDALGMHVHEESENVHTPREVWESTLATFLSKFLFSLTFLIPLFIFPMKLAVIISLLWGLNMVAFLSHLMAKEQGILPRKVILEHVAISIIVIIVTQVVGHWVSGLNFAY